jgi:hypothetical protein
MILFISALIQFGIAASGTLHSGIPVRQPELGEPAFQSAENGWSAPLSDGQGMVRVYVGRDDAAAADWFERQRESFSRALPDYAYADAAAGDGAGVLLFRDGNVAVMVKSTTDSALPLADTLRARIVDNAAPPAIATMRRTDDGWTIDAPGAVHTRVVGGGNIPFATAAAGGLFGVYTQRPTEITVWDAFGRATVIR